MRRTSSGSEDRATDEELGLETEVAKNREDLLVRNKEHGPGLQPADADELTHRLNSTLDLDATLNTLIQRGGQYPGEPSLPLPDRRPRTPR